MKTGGPFALASGKSNDSFSNNELFELADSIERYPASNASILKNEPDCLMACLPKVSVQSAISSFKESSAHTSTSNEVSFVNVLFAKSPSGPGGGDNCSTFASYTSFSGFSGHTSAWQEKEISLNSYRTVNSNHYIYFASYNATGFKGDLSVDYVQISEQAGI